MHDASCQINGPLPPSYQSILTPDALTFLVAPAATLVINSKVLLIGREQLQPQDR